MVGAWCLWLGLMAAAPEPVGPELLTNPGFEELGRAGLPAGWSGMWTRDWGAEGGAARQSDEQPHAGRYCLELSGARSQYAGQHELIPIRADRAYLLAAWIRTELVSDGQAFLAASWTVDGRYRSLTTSRRLRGRRPWTYIAVALPPDARPAEVNGVRVSFRISGSTGRGRAWVDDISFRECLAPPPPPLAEAERRRLVEMSRELLLEREVWRERLAVLRGRRADLERLLAEPAGFDDLLARFGPAVRRREFLVRDPRPRETLEATVPRDEAGIVAQVGELRELPTLRDACLRELEAILALKRRLDERPDLRRFYLCAQLAARRAEPGEGAAPTLPIDEPALFGEEPEEPTGELAELVVRARRDEQTGTGVVTITGAAHGELIVAVFDAAGRPVTGRRATVAEDAPVTLEVPRPLPWFPDYRYLYRLAVLLRRDGRIVDRRDEPVAFRTIRLVETDVSPTLRHAWEWSPTDYSYLINGQPYFPHSTVCGLSGATGLEEAVALFRELWLDAQRTYGDWLPRLAGRWGDSGLLFDASIAPDYDAIRSYVSATAGLEDYREHLREQRGLASHPALLSLQVGNEAELAVWGANLPQSYGDDLWHVFNEVTKAVREELAPEVPIAYVRAAHFGSVLPAPRNDYAGVNQYTGRYWGRRCTITSDLGALALAATSEHQPINITEWNGPKYSWATAGVSGVDEDGAAQYVYDYYRTMLRTPTVIQSTEFVLNWIVTPLEDLTTVPLAAGLAERERWQWSLQQGTPWYPHIWPGLLTDTPARRAMRGFQSPWHVLIEAPGPLTVAGPRADAARLAATLAACGREATVEPLPTADDLSKLDRHLVLLAPPGEPAVALDRLVETGVIGPVTAGFPPPGAGLVQRRVNPWFPDRYLVVVSAIDEAGYRDALGRLLDSAAGLAEALARQATCRRALALADNRNPALERYVLELPTRGGFLGRDDLRTRLDPAEFTGPDGALKPPWHELGMVLVTTRRALATAERELLLRLPGLGANVVWSAASLDANPEVAAALGVSFGARRYLTESLPVADWARAPLPLPGLGDAAADRIERFGGVKAGDARWERAVGVREVIADGWRAVAGASDRPVVAMKPAGTAAAWVFGCDLAATADLLYSVTHSGVGHATYDRDTACGLERVFRLVANAGCFGRPARSADTPRLRATVSTDREWCDDGETVRVTVRVSDQTGKPVDATVRVGCAPAGGYDTGTPRSWASPERLGPGHYTLLLTPRREPADNDLVPPVPATARYREQRFLHVFADVSRPGYVSDWTSHTIRVGPDSDEAYRASELARLVSEERFQARVNLEDRRTWVEVRATLELPARVQAEETIPLVLTVTQVEGDDGNDFMEDVTLVLRREDGQEVRLPLFEGKILAAGKASVVRDSPERCVVVTAGRPARTTLEWRATPGEWSARLTFRYTDDYHIKDTNRLAVEAPFGERLIEVPRAR